MKKIFLSLFLFFLGTGIFSPVHAQTQKDCATIKEVHIDVNEIKPFEEFKCLATVDHAHAGSETIACGISFNDMWPDNFCPSDTDFGGWHGDVAIFKCNYRYTALPANVTSVKAVAFDFRYGCGMDSGKKTSPLIVNLTVTPPPQAKAPGSQAQAIIPTDRPVTPSPAGSATISIDKLLEKKQIDYSSSVLGLAQSCLKNKPVYEQASQVTGIPWQIFAGIHYREGSCGSANSLVSGRKIGANEPDLLGNCSNTNSGPGKPVPLAGGCGFKSLLDSAIYSGNHLKGKIGKVPDSFPSLVMALSRYNGTGNSNCGKTPYNNCPPYFPGEDDTYVMNFFDSRHQKMYIVYCADYTLCNPPVADSRPGVITITNIAASL
jgi:lysozyme family protein